MTMHEKPRVGQLAGRACRGRRAAVRTADRVRRTALASLVAALAIALAACKSVDIQSVVSWREAVVATKDQSTVTFDAVGKIIRESQLDRVEREPVDKIPKLEESDFAPGLPAAALRRWNLALDQLAAYASAIEALLSPDLPAGVGDSLRQTGEQIGATAKVDLLKSDQKLSGVIAELGKQIVAAAAQRKARDVMLAIDPTIRALTAQMADMLYEARPGKDDDGKEITKESGVVVTLGPTWDDRITKVQEAFRDTTDPAVRRDLATQFADLLDQKATSVEAVMALRRSILDLAAAHTAAAQGRSADLRTLIQSISTNVKMVRELIDSIKARQEEENAKKKATATSESAGGGAP